MRNSTRIAATVASAGLIATAMAAPVGAAPSKKGTTFITPSATTNLVLQGVAKPGKLTVKGEAAFGIVGNPSDGTIEHVGGLFVNSLVSGTTLELRNFTIDLTTDPDDDGPNIGLVTGIVNDSFRAPLFEVGAPDEDGIVTLYFTETADAAIVGDILDIVGAEAGTAKIVM